MDAGSGGSPLANSIGGTVVAPTFYPRSGWIVGRVVVGWSSKAVE